MINMNVRDNAIGKEIEVDISEWISNFSYRYREEG